MEPHPPNETLTRLQQPFMHLLNKYYVRVEVDGWEHVPDGPSLVIGVHSGGTLGVVDPMRSWRKRDVAVLGGRTGFVKQAIRSGVLIVPVATVGVHDPGRQGPAAERRLPILG